MLPMQCAAFKLACCSVKSSRFETSPAVTAHQHPCTPMRQSRTAGQPPAVLRQPINRAPPHQVRNSKATAQVDDSGKVQRLRKTCPSEECGPGVFMATHFNRVYWCAALRPGMHLHCPVLDAEPAGRAKHTMLHAWL